MRPQEESGHLRARKRNFRRKEPQQQLSKNTLLNRASVVCCCGLSRKLIHSIKYFYTCWLTPTGASLLICLWLEGTSIKWEEKVELFIPFADDKVRWNWRPEQGTLELSKFLLLSLAHCGPPVAWVGQDGTVETSPEKQRNGSSRTCLWCHVCGCELNIFLHTWKQYRAPLKTIWFVFYNGLLNWFRCLKWPSFIPSLCFFLLYYLIMFIKGIGV